MKLRLFASILFLSAGWTAAAQQNPADAPASKEDIEKYLQVTHSKDMVLKMMDAMSKPMHQMIHDEYLKNKDKLPQDFEARMNKMMDDQFKNFPWEEIFNSMVPVYQKHLTKGDVDGLVAFYSSPTGQKMQKELPQIMAESMQTMMPILRKSMDGMGQRMQGEIAAMLKESEKKGGKAGEQINN